MSLASSLDPMVITLQYSDWDVKWVLIDPKSLASILFCNTFERLRLDPYDVQTFQNALVGLSNDHVQVKGHITLETIFRLNENIKADKVRHLIDVQHHLMAARPLSTGGRPANSAFKHEISFT